MLCQLYYRGRYRGFKKKSTSSTVVITEAAKGAVETAVINKPTGTIPASRPVAAQPRPATDKDSVVKKSSKLISLDNIQEVSKKAAESLGSAPLIREFNEENVLAIWTEFAEGLKATRGLLHGLMMEILPVVTEATITVTYKSDLQLGQFKSMLVPFKTHLHKHFGFNPHVILDVDAAQEVPNAKYYTPKDKLERLMEINPALRRFQRELGLDLDYD